jgi:hypothetical protein
MQPIVRAPGRGNIQRSWPGWAKCQGATGEGVFAPHLDVARYYVSIKTRQKPGNFGSIRSTRSWSGIASNSFHFLFGQAGKVDLLQYWERDGAHSKIGDNLLLGTV